MKRITPRIKKSTGLGKPKTNHPRIKTGYKSRGSMQKGVKALNKRIGVGIY